MMTNDDFEIYSSAVIINAYQDRAVGLIETRKHDELLNSFLVRNRLWKSPEKWAGFSDWGNFSFRKSDLTPIGFELMRQCHDKWLAKIDRSGKIDMGMWEKALRQADGSA
ncbi:MAG: hypothetical protein KJZ90_03485 [Rhodocyclaceae bacterium]|nr:hypothetical protein [Rhodocyclaceae bacterium]